jgi:hypothetical protein
LTPYWNVAMNFFAVEHFDAVRRAVAGRSDPWRTATPWASLQDPDLTSLRTLGRVALDVLNPQYPIRSASGTSAFQADFDRCGHRALQLDVPRLDGLDDLVADEHDPEVEAHEPLQEPRDVLLVRLPPLAVPRVAQRLDPQLGAHVVFEHVHHVVRVVDADEVVVVADVFHRFQLR